MKVEKKINKYWTMKDIRAITELNEKTDDEWIAEGICPYCCVKMKKAWVYPCYGWRCPSCGHKFPKKLD